MPLDPSSAKGAQPFFTPENRAEKQQLNGKSVDHHEAPVDSSFDLVCQCPTAVARDRKPPDVANCGYSETAGRPISLIVRSAGWNTSIASKSRSPCRKNDALLSDCPMRNADPFPEN